MNFFQRLFKQDRLPASIRGRVQPPIDREATPAPEIDHLSMQADRPIDKIADDKFDRAPFAVQIGKVVAMRQDPSSLVVGLYGPWGDGKTSVLSMIRESLAAYPNVIPMDYNPWFYGSSTEAITRSFFKSLSETLVKSTFFTTENIAQLVGILGKSVPWVGESVSAAGETLATEQLTQTRDKVGEILRRHGKKIVVFVDDIDRLDRGDIQTLFKLVRLSGGFDHTTYILAFDDVVVAEALGEAYGSGDPMAGRRFLEKIVQVPLHLPPASPDKLRQMMFSACDRAIRENGLELVDGQNIELGNGLVNALAAALKTPRQVKLFDNAVTFAIPLLKNEVRVVDQIFIEALRIFYPTIYQAVRRNPDSVLSAARDHGGRRQPPAQSPVDVAIDALDANTAEKEAVRDLLETLFPRMGRMEYGNDWDQVWAREKRICSKDYFSRYFTYAVPTGDMADQTIDELIESAISGDDAAVTTIMDAAFDRDAASLLIRKLRSHEEQMDVRAARLLSLGLASRASRLPVTNDIFLGDFATIQAAVLISQLVERLDRAAQNALLAEVAEQADTLHFVQELVRTARARTTDNGEARGFLDAEQIHPLAATMLRRLKAGTEAADVFSAAGDRLSRVVYGIEATCSDEIKDELRSFLADVLAADAGNAVLFLKAFAGRSQGGNGVIGVSDFSRNAYNGIADLFDLDALYARLRETYGAELDNVAWENDWNGAGNVDRRVANQFSFLHRNQAAVPGEEPD